jgi:hypothetical protein
MAKKTKRFNARGKNRNRFNIILVHTPWAYCSAQVTDLILQKSCLYRNREGLSLSCVMYELSTVESLIL